MAYRKCDPMQPKMASVLLMPNTVPKAVANCRYRCTLLPGVGCCELELGASFVCNAYKNPWLIVAPNRTNMATFCNTGNNNRTSLTAWKGPIGSNTPTVKVGTNDNSAHSSDGNEALSIISIVSLSALGLAILILLYCLRVRCQQGPTLDKLRKADRAFRSMSEGDDASRISGLVESLRREMDEKVTSLTAENRARIAGAQNAMMGRSVYSMSSPPTSAFSFGDEDAANFAWDNTDFVNAGMSSPLSPHSLRSPGGGRMEPLYARIPSGLEGTHDTLNQLYSHLGGNTHAPTVPHRRPSSPHRLVNRSFPLPSLSMHEQSLAGSQSDMLYEEASSVGSNTSVYECASNFMKSPLSPGSTSVYEVASPTYLDDAQSEATSMYQIASPQNHDGSEFGADSSVYEVASPQHVADGTADESLYQVAAPNWPGGLQSVYERAAPSRMDQLHREASSDMYFSSDEETDGTSMSLLAAACGPANHSRPSSLLIGSLSSSATDPGSLAGYTIRKPTAGRPQSLLIETTTSTGTDHSTDFAGRPQSLLIETTASTGTDHSTDFKLVHFAGGSEKHTMETETENGSDDGNTSFDDNFAQMIDDMQNHGEGIYDVRTVRALPSTVQAPPSSRSAYSTNHSRPSSLLIGSMSSSGEDIYDVRTVRAPPSTAYSASEDMYDVCTVQAPPSTAYSASEDVYDVRTVQKPPAQVASKKKQMSSLVHFSEDMYDTRMVSQSRRATDWTALNESSN